MIQFYIYYTYFLSWYGNAFIFFASISIRNTIGVKEGI